ncbi:MAG TPA: anhydro-N-acetylmuramic acid kinase [Rudaea sp.]|nr:anhydro-N-acetylmuramic acid kinase [Rudaea sp.]
MHASSGDLFVGLISGTSADGIDAALCSFAAQPCLHAALTHPYPQSLRQRILELAQGDGMVALDELGALDVEIGQNFAVAANALIRQSGLEPSRVVAIGSHGQTVRHRPQQTPAYTLQLGDANTIAEMTDITTVADFRRRDMAAGGQGAPLAPAFHAAMLPADGRTRVVLNLGGIANITIIPAESDAVVRGFDTGPASCLLDAWAQQHLGQAYDADGAFAAHGRIDESLLQRLLSDVYFDLPPPKSTGRETFHAAWLQQHLRDRHLQPQDVQATLVALTAQSIAAAIGKYAPGAVDVLACGGGVHNGVLMTALAAALKPVPVASTATRGIDPDYVEAMCFAWLARARIAGRSVANIATVTGARGARVLGGIYFGR